MLTQGSGGCPTAPHYGRQIVPVAWYLLQFGAARPLLRLNGLTGPVALAAVWTLTAVGLTWLHRRAPSVSRARLDRAWPALAFAGAVAIVGLIAYPIFDARESTGGGSDADDAVVLVIDGLRTGQDPYAVDTYLGNPPAAGPGAALWFFPWSSRGLYPIGIALAVGVTVAVLRAASGGWAWPTLFAALLAASVPFWEGVGQGSDHLPFACSLVWAAAILDRRRPPPGLALAIALGAALGVLATTRAAFFFVPAVAAATLWWRDRRAALVIGAVGTAAVVGLHAAFIALSGWDDYAPVQQLLVKSDEDLNNAGRALVVAGLVVGIVGVVAELRRREESRVAVALLLAVGAPMTAIALAGLLTASEPSQWSAGSYLVDTVALAAAWFAGSVLARAGP
jgi:hypothetical protein